MAEPVITAAADRGVGVVTRLNLLKGFLTGRYAPGHRFADPANDGRASIPPKNLDRVLGIVKDIEARGLPAPYQTMTQLALAFPLSHPGVSAIIPGGRSCRQVESNLAINDLPPLSEKQAAELVAAAAEIRRFY